MYTKLANGFGLPAIAAVAVRKPQLSEMLKAAIRTTGLVHREQDASLRTYGPALMGLFPVTRLYGRFCKNVGLRAFKSADGTVQCVDNGPHDDCQRSLILFRQVKFWVVRFEQAFDDIFPDPRLLFALGDGSSLKPTFVGDA